MLIPISRIRRIALSLALAALPMLAQQPAPAAQALRVFSSSADVSALIARAKSDRREGQSIVIEKILDFAPYSANLEYRPAAGAAAVHETMAEMMYVIDGAGTLVTGGKLVGETRTNAANLSGKSIEGGVARRISKGDFLVVPEGTPHWFSAVDPTLVLMTVKMPRGAAAK